jgi:hypothetical protein
LLAPAAVGFATDPWGGGVRADEGSR